MLVFYDIIDEIVSWYQSLQIWLSLSDDYY